MRRRKIMWLLYQHKLRVAMPWVVSVLAPSLTPTRFGWIACIMYYLIEAVRIN